MALRVIPHLLSFIEMAESALDEEKDWFVINDLHASGAIAEHRDAVSCTALAVNLLGEGEVSFTDTDATKYRFATGPGNGFVIRNGIDRSRRPLHSVRAVHGPRVSIAL